MELIPILSLIILVSTISTFILAVGAYVLFKVRERRGQTAKAKPPETIPAELVEPTPVLTDSRATKTHDKTFATEERAATFATGNDLTRSTLFKSTADRDQTGFTRPTFVTQNDEGRKRFETAESERYTGKGKFLRYTGEIEEEKPRSQKQDPPRKNEDNLQWR